MKNQIVFSADGKEFTIKFVSGSESTSITNKKDGLSALVDLLNRRKIEPDEYLDMRDQVIEAKNLPESESNFEGFQIGNMFGILGLMLTGNILNDIINAPDKPVESPYLKLCKSCGNHGRIYTKASYTKDLTTKEDALKALQKLKEQDHINGEEFERLEQEIKTSALA